MEKPIPSDILLIGVIIHLGNILFKDTSSVHDIAPIPNNIFLSILLMFLLVSGIPALLNSAPSVSNLMLSGAILLAIAGTILEIFDFSTTLTIFKLLISLIAILVVGSLYQVKSEEGRLYLLLLIILFINLQTILYPDLVNNDIVLLIDLLFELTFFAALVYFIYIQKFERNKLIILGTVGIVAISLGLFILTKETPLLIISTVIEETLGIRQFSLDLLIFNITTDFLFVLHVTEYLILATVLVLRPPSKLWLTIILCGFNFTFTPLGGFRALAILYYINRSDHNLDKFQLK